MSHSDLHENTPLAGGRQAEPIDEVILSVVPEPTPRPEAPPQPLRRRWVLPLVLFLATCASTFLVGGSTYALCLMTILVCHEAGHFVQSWRYGVHSSFPFFIPMPFSPIGTLGAVIGMSSNIPSRRALFDIGITGPLAGLVPTMIFCMLGLIYDSHLGREILVRDPRILQFGEPILFKLLGWLRFGPIPEGYTIYIGPMAMAGWVGMLITALNLFPIGQLDGGHVLYALLRRRAHVVATAILLGSAVLVVWFHYFAWILMIVLLMLMGPNHPPTSDDHVPLGTVRIILGWLTLGFLLVGFTPNPISF
jgi:membrane-associated protease RseP (regulator of RpoE activity)